MITAAATATSSGSASLEAAAAPAPDAGDYIRHRLTQTHHVVACVHDEVIYTAGNPSRTLHIADCEIVQQASPQPRLGQPSRL